MALGMSTALSNARLDAIETTIGTSPILRIYGGSTPVDCAASIGSATLLFEVTLPSDWLEAALGGTKAARYWPIAVASASGTASFFRIFESTGTTCHAQGACSTIGGGGTLILDSTTITSGRGLGIVDFVLRAPEAPTFSGALSKTLGTLTDSAAGTVVSASWNSIDLGDWGKLDSQSAPPNGALFSIWSRRNDPAVSFPFSSGNHEFLDFQYSNWRMRVIGFNCSAASSGDTDCMWNSNSMMLADGTSVGESATSYVGDYTFLIENGHTVSQLNGWVFHAFQVWNDSANSQIILRLWVKFSGSSVQGPYSTIKTYTQIRSDLVSNGGWTQAHADSWTPSTTTSVLTIGSNFDTVKIHVIHGRVESNTGSPTNAEIETVAALSAADTSAWSDWELNWSGGSANLTDRSGNSRTLTTGSTLVQGVAFP